MNTSKFASIAVGVAAACTFMASLPAQAGPVHDAPLFTDNTLAANDDGSTGLVNIGFAINFYGVMQSNLYVNNNGNVTFTGPLSTFTPFSLLSTNTSIIAPFFADVDTRGAGSGLTQYGQDVLNGHNVFGVNWIGVGYFASKVNKLNTFQLILTDRSDTGAGNFDFEFNYDQIQWETGEASNGVNGLGGSSARVGYSNGSNTSFELAGSAVNGALLDGGPNALIRGSLNSNVAGRYIFNVRNGAVVVPPGTVPEPESIALIGLGALGLALARRRKSK
jgi:Nidogen-like/PEP-CTERM motif